MHNVDLNESNEVREYEKRIQNLKNQYTDEELTEWKRWAEKWAEIE